MEVLLKSKGQPTVIPVNGLFPLPILKQVITMFFSVNRDRFREVHPELVRFVLNRDHPSRWSRTLIPSKNDATLTEAFHIVRAGSTYGCLCAPGLLPII